MADGEIETEITLAVLSTKLDGIKSSIIDLRADLKAKPCDEHGERLAAIEAVAKRPNNPNGRNGASVWRDRAMFLLALAVAAALGGAEILKMLGGK